MLRDWELHVHFKVHGQGTDLFGDGMALWYVKDRMQPGNIAIINYKVDSLCMGLIAYEV